MIWGKPLGRFWNSHSGASTGNCKTFFSVCGTPLLLLNIKTWLCQDLVWLCSLCCGVWCVLSISTVTCVRYQQTHHKPHLVTHFPTARMRGRITVMYVKLRNRTYRPALPSTLCKLHFPMKSQQSSASRNLNGITWFGCVEFKKKKLIFHIWLFYRLFHIPDMPFSLKYI